MKDANRPRDRDDAGFKDADDTFLPPFHFLALIMLFALIILATFL